MATNTPSRSPVGCITARAFSIRARLAWLLDGDRCGPCPAAMPRSEQG